MNPEVSIVIPLHNEEGNMGSLYLEIKETMKELMVGYEVVLVNDGSTDMTGQIIRGIAEKDRSVRVVELDGNFGEAAALSAGYHFSRGRWIVTMDGDGQNDPKDIPVILEKLKMGYKAVSGWRRERQEAYWLRIFPSRMANWIISQITGVRVHDNGCGLKGYEASLVRAFLIPHGFHRFLPALFGVKGNEVTEVVVRDRRRRYGTSHYGLGRILEVLRELVTIRFVIRDARGWYGRFRAILLMTSAVSLASLSYLMIAPSSLSLVFFLIIGIVNLLSCVVYLNLERFVSSQQEGVFRGKEI